LRALQAAHFDFDGAEASVARFVGRVVAEAVLLADVGGDLRDARAAFAQVAADIGKQYSLGYYSTNKARDGRFRQIRVEVRGLQGAQVIAREGYQATKS
jgi:hypothetical protein